MKLTIELTSVDDIATLKTSLLELAALLSKAEEPESFDILQEPLDFLELTTRPQRALYHYHKIRTVGDLTALTEAELRSLDGLGRKSIDEIQDVMKRHNLRFKCDPNPPEPHRSKWFKKITANNKGAAR